MTASMVAHCRECGEELTTTLPIDIDDFIDLGKQFMAAHTRSCGKNTTFMGTKQTEELSDSRPVPGSTHGGAS